MLTQEQQNALSGTGAYGPSLPPPSGSTFRPFPGEAGRPNIVSPGQKVPGSFQMMGDFLLIALLGMLG
jgi:hypothetical protein